MMQHKVRFPPPWQQPMLRAPAISVANTKGNTSSALACFTPVKSQMSHKFREGEVLQQLDQAEDELSTEKLNTRQSRLHEEVNKIRRWKLQTETDLKQKDRKLQDASQTIESLRKSMLSQQLQNESLSLKLQEEIDNKEEIMQKIKATRNLCSALKSYAEKLEDRMQRCEVEKTELKHVQKQYMTELEELSGQFKQLEISAAENSQKLNDTLKLKQEEVESIKTKHEQTLNAAKGELVVLMEQEKQKSKEIHRLTSQLEENAEKFTSLFQMHSQLQEKLAETDAILVKQTQELTCVRQELDSTQAIKLSLKKKLDETTTQLHETMVNKDKLAKTFDETEELYVKKLKSGQDELESFQAQLERSKQLVGQLQVELSQADKVVQELKSATDTMTLKRDEAMARVKELEATQKELLEKIRTTEDKLENMGRSLLEKHEEHLDFKKAYEILQCDLKQAQTEAVEHKREVGKVKENLLQTSTDLMKREADLRQTTIELKEAVDSQTELSSELSALKAELESISKEKQTAAQDLVHVRNDKQAMQKELNSIKKEAAKLQKELENANSREDQTRAKLEEAVNAAESRANCVTELKEQLEEQLDSIEKLTQENANLQSLGDKLSDRSRHASEVEEKIKAAKSDLCLKNKQIKELEKESRSLKSKLTSREKCCTSREDQIRQLEEHLKSKQEHEEQLERELEEEQKKAEQTEETAQQQTQRIEQLEAEVEKMSREREEETLAYEVRVREVADMLNQYKVDYDKMVAKKSDQVEKMEQEMEALTKQNDNNHKLKKELEKYKEKNADYETRLNEKAQVVDSLEEELSKLQKQLKEKNNITALEATGVQEVQNSGTPPRKPLLMHCSAQPQQATEMAAPTHLLRLATPRRSAVVSAQFKTPQPSRPQPMVTPSNSTLRSAPKWATLSAPRLAAIKKRKVTFQHDSDDAGSESSAAYELMEMDDNEMDQHLQSAITPRTIPTTPLLLRAKASPKLHSSPTKKKAVGSTTSRQRNWLPNWVTDTIAVKTAIASKPKASTPKTSAVLVKSKLQSKRQKSKEQDMQELEQFRNLFPEAQNDPALCGTAEQLKPKGTSARTQPSAPKIRKAPSKNIGKFFTSSPSERKRMKKKNSKEAFSWIDNDGTFGMTPED